MKSRSSSLLGVGVVMAFTLVPAAARAGDCSATLSPDPGWVGAVVTFAGSGLQPNVGYDIRIGGGPIINLAASPTGTFSYQYTIPATWDSGQSSVGVTEWYVFVQSGCKPMGDEAEPYTVLAAQPTTTTVSPVTTSVTTQPTTTTGASTTTVAASATTTTAAQVTTTVAAVETTTTSAEVTTTTEPSTDNGGSSPVVLIVILGFLVLGGGVLLGRKMGMRRS